MSERRYDAARRIAYGEGYKQARSETQPTINDLRLQLDAEKARVTRLQAEVERLTKERDENDAKIAELEARIAAGIKMIEDSPNGINGFLIRVRAYLLGGRGPYRPEDSDG